MQVRTPPFLSPDRQCRITKPTLHHESEFSKGGVGSIRAYFTEEAHMKQGVSEPPPLLRQGYRS